MTFFKDFFSSFLAYFEALAFMSSQKLWKFAIIPGIISMLIAFAIGYLSYQLHDEIGQKIVQWYPWEFGKSAFEIVGGIGSSLLMFILFILVYKNFVVVAVSPFMSPLSIKVEDTLLNKVNASNQSDFALIIRGLQLSLRNVIKEIIFTIPLFLLSFIPIIGIFFTILILMIQSYYAGFGNLDYALERYLNRKESIEFVRKNRGLALGNGSAFLLLLAIPIVGIFVAPALATVAGSMSAIRKINHPIS